MIKLFLLFIVSISYLSVSCYGAQCNDFAVKLSNNATVDETAVQETKCASNYCWSLLTSHFNNRTGAVDRWVKGGCTKAYVCEQFPSECVYGEDGVMATSMGSAAVGLAARKTSDIVTPNSICCCRGDDCNSLVHLMAQAHLQLDDPSVVVTMTNTSDVSTPSNAALVHASVIDEATNSAISFALHGVSTSFFVIVALVLRSFSC